MAALRVVPPDAFVGAVESIPLVSELIGRLAERGASYEVDGDWYFPVSADPTFGAVSGLSRPEMVELFGERGGDPDRTGKKDPLDCLVWQRERPGEPAWDSPLGRGRPGWHIECTAIAAAHLGLPLAVQGGGRDLVFPHHEMCAAGGQVATGSAAFAHAYVHAGMVGLDGEKMSKSRGNLIFLSELRRAGHDPMAIRLALLDHHYRGDWDWTSPGLVRAEDRLHRWRQATDRACGPSADRLVVDVRAALASDLDTPAALRLVDAWVEQTLAGPGNDSTAPALVATLCDTRLGVLL
jgi:L-cysteine:1D-myo-inositol 2-amino-2-deoxy-alpha-D-glucopyranoside ligase